MATCQGQGGAPSSFPMVEWKISQEQVPYPEAVEAMEARVAAIRTGAASELVWLLEHPALFSAGTSARDEDLLQPVQLPVYRTGRGGQFTYHGPGQRVAYVLLDLRPDGNDLRAHVRRLEDWTIKALADFGVKGERREGRVGIWVARTGGREEKIAAIGVRVRHWIAFHGLSINLAPNLEHYAGIVPCGLSAEKYGVTSLQALGVRTDLAALDASLLRHFPTVFGRELEARASAA